MTKGLEHTGKIKLKLYRQCLEAASTEEDRKEYTAYRNVFNNLKRNLKLNTTKESAISSRIMQKSYGLSSMI